MNSLGDQFLTGAAFTLYQNGRFGRGHYLYMVKYLHEIIAFANYTGECIAFRTLSAATQSSLAQRLVFLLGITGNVDHHQYFLFAEWLYQETIGAGSAGSLQNALI